MRKYINACNRNEKEKIVLFSIMISTLVIMMIPASMNSFDMVYAQGSNNAIGQEGEGNEAFQSEENTQEADKNSMCVSGEITSLSCNNLSSENIGGTVGEGPQGEQGPQGETGPPGAGAIEVYSKESSVSSNPHGDFGVGTTLLCDSGDFATGGGIDTEIDPDATGVFLTAVVSGPSAIDQREWMASATTNSDEGGVLAIRALVTCMDITP